MIEHLSPSSWKLLEECPRKWARRYIDGIKDPVGWEAEVGTMSHAVLEGLYGDEPELRTVERARQHAHTLWTYEPEKLELESIARGEIAEVDFKRRSWRAVLGDFEIEDPTEVDVVATEQEVEWTEGGVPFKAKVDRVERLPALGPGLVTNDYKTGKVPDPRHIGAHKRQVVIGAMGVAATMGAPAQGGSLLYVGQSEVIPVDTTLRARQSTLEAAQETWEWMRRATEYAVTWTDLEPSVGPLCNWCPAAADCDAGRGYIRRAELGGWKSYYPDAIGARLVAEKDGTTRERF